MNVEKIIEEEKAKMEVDIDNTANFFSELKETLIEINYYARIITDIIHGEASDLKERYEVGFHLLKDICSGIVENNWTYYKNGKKYEVAVPKVL